MTSPVPRRAGPDPVAIGHRGAAAHVPENTLRSFEAAWAAGADWVEADTQPTADGVPVTLHDATLDRTTTGTGPVRECTADDVAAVRIRDRPGDGVPTLGALLQRVTGNRAVLLELKGEHTSAQLSAVLRAIRTHGCAERVLLQSFEVPVLRRLAANAPGLPFGLLVEDLDDDPVGRCRELGAIAYNPRHRVVLERPDVIPRLRAAGLAVAAWTADDPADWAALTAAGVDAIITNDPERLLRWQAARR
jgi:glycerophosphoryl diester phosphodiesterase